MKKEDLYEAIGEIKEEYIEEAHKDYAENKKKRNILWRSYMSIVGSVAAMFLIVVALAKFVDNIPGSGNKSEAPVGEAETEAIPEGATEEDGATEEEEYIEEGAVEEEIEGDVGETNSEDGMTGSYGEGTQGVEGEIMYYLPETVRDFFGGWYLDKSGKLHIYITEDSKENRALICEEYEKNEEDVVFQEGKYTFAYLLELKSKIFDAELPFVMSVVLNESTNNILVRVTTEDEEELQKLYKLDTIGGAICVEVSVNEEMEDVTTDEAVEEEPVKNEIE